MVTKKKNKNSNSTNTDKEKFKNDLTPFMEIAKALTSTLNQKEVLNIIMKEISGLFHPKNWSLLLLDEEKQELYFEIAIGKNSEYLKDIKLKIGEGIAGWVAKTGEAIISDDPYNDKRFFKKIDEKSKFKTESIIAVPLKSKGNILGVIELINELKDGSFSKDDLTIVQALADFAAIAIENARYVVKVKELTIRDDVTGLYNARYLQESLDKEVNRSRRHNRKFSLIFLDLDHFKKINDTYGHLVGSKLLKEFAVLVNEFLRDMDVPTRYGGDEYVLILPETDKKQAYTVAKRLRDTLNEYIFLKDEDFEIKITASFGVATYPDDALHKLDLLRLADNAMYKVKETTRNDVALA